MKKATVTSFIDRYHPQKDGNCKVSIRVTHQRKKKYYATNICLKADDYDRIIAAKRRNDGDRNIYNRIQSFVTKAVEAVDCLPLFTFDKFEEIYLNNREAIDSISSGFDKYIKELRNENRVGTAVSYEVAKRSLESFKKGLKYADITPSLLRSYETWMLEHNKSITTVGIYLRSLRSIFNRANIDKSLYPFGQGKGKYNIPTGKNIKKALTKSEIEQIFNYTIEENKPLAMARDYWTFIYMGNGINVKDLCLLKKKNISGDLIIFERAKTKRKKDNNLIRISLQPQMRNTIAKWGVLSLDPESYIFPHLKKGMSPEIERQVVQQLTKTINKYMKRVTKEIGLNKNVTTYTARHSFATILKYSGASVEYISEALGHAETKTTKSYLAGFDDKTIHETSKALTAF
jgi:integrase/recombinase XerD